jgi:tetratricopeptide (TPR) repeat protein
MNSKKTIRAEDLSPRQRNALLAGATAELRRNPRNVDAYLAIASIHGAERNLDAAIATLLKALSLSKKNPDILVRIVAAANDKGDLPTARKYVRKLIEVQPKIADNYLTLALIHERMGQPDQAIKYFLKALSLEPRSDQTMYDIGRCYALKGDEDQSIEYFLRALEVNPHNGMALYSYSTAKKLVGEEAEHYLSRLRAALLQPENLKDDVIIANIHYAIGKILDDTNRYDEAISEFKAANSRRRQDNAVAKVLSAFTNTFDAFTRDVIFAKSGLGHPSSQAIFIVGMPRSGTTLTESLCGGHSKISAADEQLFIPRMVKRLGQRSSAIGAYRRNIEGLSKSSLNVFAEEYLESMKHLVGDAPYFIDKLPHNFMNLGFIDMILPNSKFILCRRHPLDNCLSIFANSMTVFHNSYKTDLSTLGIYFRQYCQLIDHWKNVLPGKIHEVFYEDLIVNTEYNAREMIKHIGLEWEEGIMDRQGSQRSVRNLSVWQVRQPIYQSSKGRWRNYQKHLGPLIDAIGPYVESYERELETLSGKETA